MNTIQLFGGKPRRKIPDGNTHSRSYHRHFNGYVEYTVLNPKGNGVKIERVYTAPYYVCGGSPRAQAGFRLGLPALWLGAAAAFLRGGVLPCLVNRIKPTAVVQTVIVVLAVWLGKGILALLFAPKRMTIAEFQGSVQAIRQAGTGLAVAAACNLLYCAGAALYCAEWPLPLFCWHFVALALWAAAWLLQRRMPWTTVENENRDVAGVPIGPG